jgi:hypothetical protein
MMQYDAPENLSDYSRLRSTKLCVNFMDLTRSFAVGDVRSSRISRTGLLDVCKNCHLMCNWGVISYSPPGTKDGVPPRCGTGHKAGLGDEPMNMDWLDL